MKAAKKILLFIKEKLASIWLVFRILINLNLLAIVIVTGKKIRMIKRELPNFFIFKMWNTDFTLISKKQSIVTLSTCEVEFVSATSCVCHAMWLKNWLKELNLPQMKPMEIYVDNKFAITLPKNSVFHDQNDHIDTRYHFIRDSIMKKEL